MKRAEKKPKVSLQTTVDSDVAEEFKRMATQEGRTVANHLRLVVNKAVNEGVVEKKR